MTSSGHLLRRVALALVTIVLLAAIVAIPASARVGACPGSVSAGSRHAVYMHAFDIRATALSCRAAHRVIGAFLTKKLTGPGERCAAAAGNPPFSGCIVDGLRCRATSEPGRSAGIAAELCTAGRRRVSFDEIDSDNG